MNNQKHKKINELLVKNVIGVEPTVSTWKWSYIGTSFENLALAAIIGGFTAIIGTTGSIVLIMFLLGLRIYRTKNVIFKEDLSYMGYGRDSLISWSEPLKHKSSIFDNRERTIHRSKLDSLITNPSALSNLIQEGVVSIKDVALVHKMEDIIEQQQSQLYSFLNRIHHAMNGQDHQWFLKRFLELTSNKSLFHIQFNIKERKKTDEFKVQFNKLKDTYLAWYKDFILALWNIFNTKDNNRLINKVQSIDDAQDLQENFFKQTYQNTIDSNSITDDNKKKSIKKIISIMSICNDILFKDKKIDLDKLTDIKHKISHLFQGDQILSYDSNPNWNIVIMLSFIDIIHESLISDINQSLDVLIKDITFLEELYGDSYNFIHRTKDKKIIDTKHHFIHFKSSINKYLDHVKLNLSNINDKKIDNLEEIYNLFDVRRYIDTKNEDALTMINNLSRLWYKLEKQNIWKRHLQIISTKDIKDQNHLLDASMKEYCLDVNHVHWLSYHDKLTIALMIKEYFNRSRSNNSSILCDDINISWMLSPCIFILDSDYILSYEEKLQMIWSNIVQDETIKDLLLLFNIKLTSIRQANDLSNSISRIPKGGSIDNIWYWLSFQNILKGDINNDEEFLRSLNKLLVDRVPLNFTIDKNDLYRWASRNIKCLEKIGHTVINADIKWYQSHDSDNVLSEPFDLSNTLKDFNNKVHKVEDLKKDISTFTSDGITLFLQHLNTILIKRWYQLLKCRAKKLNSFADGSRSIRQFMEVAHSEKDRLVYAVKENNLLFYARKLYDEIDIDNHTIDEHKVSNARMKIYRLLSDYYNTTPSISKKISHIQTLIRSQNNNRSIIQKIQLDCDQLKKDIDKYQSSIIGENRKNSFEDKLFSFFLSVDPDIFDNENSLDGIWRSIMSIVDQSIKYKWNITKKTYKEVVKSLWISVKKHIISWEKLVILYSLLAKNTHLNHDDYIDNLNNIEDARKHLLQKKQDDDFIEHLTEYILCIENIYNWLNYDYNSSNDNIDDQCRSSIKDVIQKVYYEDDMWSELWKIKFDKSYLYKPNFFVRYDNIDWKNSNLKNALWWTIANSIHNASALKEIINPTYDQCLNDRCDNDDMVLMIIDYIRKNSSNNEYPWYIQDWDVDKNIEKINNVIKNIYQWCTDVETLFIDFEKLYNWCKNSTELSEALSKLSIHISKFKSIDMIKNHGLGFNIQHKELIPVLKKFESESKSINDKLIEIRSNIDQNIITKKKDFEDLQRQSNKLYKNSTDLRKEYMILLDIALKFHHDYHATKDRLKLIWSYIDRQEAWIDDYKYISKLQDKENFNVSLYSTYCKEIMSILSLFLHRHDIKLFEELNQKSVIPYYIAKKIDAPNSYYLKIGGDQDQEVRYPKCNNIINDIYKTDKDDDFFNEKFDIQQAIDDVASKINPTIKNILIGKYDQAQDQNQSMIDERHTKLIHHILGVKRRDTNKECARKLIEFMFFIKTMIELEDHHVLNSNVDDYSIAKTSKDIIKGVILNASWEWLIDKASRFTNSAVFHTLSVDKMIKNIQNNQQSLKLSYIEEYFNLNRYKNFINHSNDIYDKQWFNFESIFDLHIIKNLLAYHGSNDYKFDDTDVHLRTYHGLRWIDTYLRTILSSHHIWKLMKSYTLDTDIEDLLKFKERCEDIIDKNFKSNEEEHPVDRPQGILDIDDNFHRVVTDIQNLQVRMSQLYLNHTNMLNNELFKEESIDSIIQKNTWYVDKILSIIDADHPIIVERYKFFSNMKDILSLNKPKSNGDDLAVAQWILSQCKLIRDASSAIKLLKEKLQDLQDGEINRFPYDLSCSIEGKFKFKFDHDVLNNTDNFKNLLDAFIKTIVNDYSIDRNSTKSNLDTTQDHLQKINGSSNEIKKIIEAQELEEGVQGWKLSIKNRLDTIKSNLDHIILSTKDDHIIHYIFVEEFKINLSTLRNLIERINKDITNENYNTSASECIDSLQKINDVLEYISNKIDKDYIHSMVTDDIENASIFDYIIKMYEVNEKVNKINDSHVKSMNVNDLVISSILKNARKKDLSDRIDIDQLKQSMYKDTFDFIINRVEEYICCINSPKSMNSPESMNSPISKDVIDHSVENLCWNIVEIMKIWRKHDGSYKLSSPSIKSMLDQKFIDVSIEKIEEHDKNFISRVKDKLLTSMKKTEVHSSYLDKEDIHLLSVANKFHKPNHFNNILDLFTSKAIDELTTKQANLLTLQQASFVNVPTKYFIEHIKKNITPIKQVKQLLSFLSHNKELLWFMKMYETIGWLSTNDIKVFNNIKDTIKNIFDGKKEDIFLKLDSKDLLNTLKKLYHPNHHDDYKMYMEHVPYIDFQKTIVDHCTKIEDILWDNNLKNNDSVVDFKHAISSHVTYIYNTINSNSNSIPFKERLDPVKATNQKIVKWWLIDPMNLDKFENQMYAIKCSIIDWIKLNIDNKKRIYKQIEGLYEADHDMIHDDQYNIFKKLRQDSGKYNLVYVPSNVYTYDVYNDHTLWIIHHKTNTLNDNNAVNIKLDKKNWYYNIYLDDLFDKDDTLSSIDFFKSDTNIRSDEYVKKVIDDRNPKQDMTLINLCYALHNMNIHHLKLTFKDMYIYDVDSKKIYTPKKFFKLKNITLDKIKKSTFLWSDIIKKYIRKLKLGKSFYDKFMLLDDNITNMLEK